MRVVNESHRFPNPRNAISNCRPRDPCRLSKSKPSVMKINDAEIRMIKDATWKKNVVR